jgi:hypothetical protein
LTITDQTNYRRIQSYGQKPLVLNSVGNNVGIGTTNPEEKLHVSGNLKVTGNIYSTSIVIHNMGPSIYFQDTDHRSVYINTTLNKIWFYRTDGNNSTTRQDYNGFPIMEINLENNKLQFGGNLNFKNSLDVVGNVTAYYSDIRLKTIISEIKDPLNKVQSLNGFYYKPNELANKMGITSTNVEIGLSAQDVQNILPELVKLAPLDCEDDDVSVSKSGNNYLTISYARLIPLLVESIKQLSKKLNILTTKITELEKSIDRKQIKKY